MRFPRSLAAGIGLLAALSLSCDSTDPLLLEGQLASLSFVAQGGSIATYDVWDMIEDSGSPCGASGFCDDEPATACTVVADCPSDGLPDDGIVYLWCESQFVSQFAASSIPWNYSLEVTVIRAGSPIREVIVEPTVVNITNNLAPYATNAMVRGVTPPKGDIVEQGRRFVFSDPRRSTSARQELVEASSNPLDTLNPGLLPGPGICFPEPGPGDARIDSGPYPFEIELLKGDTVIVEARIVEDPPSGFIVPTPPNLLASFAVDGVAVAIDGNASSNFGANTGVSFSFTSR